MNLIVVWVLGDPALRLRTDWTAFDNAADRLFEGTEIYRPWKADVETLPYLYPPFALWLTIPLRLGGFYLSWAIAAGMTAASLAAGVRFLASSMPSTFDRVTGVMVAATTGSFFGATLLGQYSGLYVLAFGLAAWLWHRQRDVLAGLALGLLLLKPNIAVAVPVVLVWSRSWRVLGGFGFAALGAAAASVPFGVDQWSAFISNVRDMGERQIAGQLFEEKFVSFSGAMQTFTGRGAEDGLIIGVWLVVTALLGVATLLVWHPARLAGNTDRALGLLAVFVIAANPRMYFYDGALAIWGMLALWMYAKRTGDTVLARRLGWLALPLWVTSWGNAFEVLNAYFGLVIVAVILTVGVHASERSFDAVIDSLPTPSASSLAKAGVVMSGVVIVLMAAWALGDTSRLETDWTAFDLAAERVVAGESPYVFNPAVEPFPYLYPPFAIWLALPLAPLGFIGSWVFSALLTTVAFAASVALFARVSPTRPTPEICLAFTMVGAAVTAALIGQYSGLLALSVALGAYLHRHDRHVASGVALAMLLLKPNLAIAVLIVVLWSRSWPMLKGFVAGGAALALSTVPLGLSLWRDWQGSIEAIAQAQVDGRAPVDKMITVYGAMQELLGLSQSSPLALALWVIVAVIAGRALLMCWQRDVLAQAPLVAFASLALFMVAANLRVYFYDGTLVALGLFGLFLTTRDRALTTRRDRRLANVVVVAGWVSLWGGVVLPLNQLTGAISLAATVLLARVATRTSSRTQHAPAEDHGDEAALSPQLASDLAA